MKVFVALASVALMVTAIHAGKVSPTLQASLDMGESLDISIYLEDQMDIFKSNTLMALEGEAKVQKMISMLKERTSVSQKPLLDAINRNGKSSKDVVALWITNFIRVKNASKDLVASLAEVPGEFLIREPIVASIIQPVQTTSVNVTQNIQWGIQKIEAHRAWTVTRGEGTIVGIIDSGVHIQHEALRDNFGGGWFDPYYNTPEPTDVLSHGTHALGAAVGTTNGIGVAPGAKWIACRGLNHQGTGYDAELLGCGEWMLTANPRPNVVSNSWGVGYTDPWYNQVVAAWRGANIIPVFAVGNSGPSCGSVVYPANQPGLIAVGATDQNDVMAAFSSRGPGVGGRVKPEVSAPGANIVSAGNTGTNSYTIKSGTSMATPHVAGAVALYISVNPSATYEQVLDALLTTGDRPTVSNADRNCGNPESDWPNMAFGYGRLNAATLVGAGA